MFETLEEAIAAYTQLEAEHKSLKTEKTALIRKRDELLSELKTTKAKLAPFADYADLDIPGLLKIKEEFEAGDNATKARYEAAYKTDKEKLEARLRTIEEERQAEKTERERERAQAAAASLKADALGEFTKEAHRIRSPEQFYRLFGEGKIQRGEDGKLFVGDEYKQVSLSDYVAQISEDEENGHHFRPKGGSGSGSTASQSGGSKAGINPFSKKTWNLTEQGRLFRENKPLYDRLKAEAGA